MAQLIQVPHLGTVEEDVVVAEWKVAEGSPVRAGETIVVVETLKAPFEVEAEADGILLRRLAAAGERIPARAALALVAAAGERPPDDEIAGLLRRAQALREAVPAAETTSPARDVEPGPGRDGAGAPRAGPVAAAPAARRRAAELGLAREGITGTGPGGLVRLEDVEAAARAGAPAREADGRLDAAFLDQVRRDPAAFGALGTELKVLLYRRFGARIGGGVRIGPGAVIVAETLELGEGCRFGPDCRIEAVEFRAGPLAQFGPRCAVRCRSVRLGANAFFVADVEIGGGGAMDPEAELIVGSHGFVGEHVHLNPCRRLELGDEVVVSRNAVLMTHSLGGNALSGYPNRFAGVRIGDRCQIGIGAVLFPGVEMGQGSILLSGSSLVTSVPPGRLFGGVPARDLKAAARSPSEAERAALAHAMVVEFGRQLGLRGLDVDLEEAGDSARLTVRAEGAEHRLSYAPRWTAPADAALRREEVRVALAVDDAQWESIPPEVTAIDLGAPRIRGGGGPLADAFREFLRKRGIRLRPRTWTYPGGWL